MMFFLALGSFIDLGWKHIPKILLFQVFLTIGYVGVNYLIKRKEKDFSDLIKLSGKKLDLISYSLVVSIVVIISLVFVYTNGFPIVKAFISEDYYWIAELRKKIFRATPILLKYSAFITFKAIIPFLIVYYFSRKNKWMVALLIAIGFLYSINLLNKSIILSVLVPIMIFSAFKRKWILSALSIGLVVLHTYVLIYGTNPEIRPEWNLNKGSAGQEYSLSKEEVAEIKKKSSIKKANNLLVHRVFLLPGEMVNNWFELIPEEKPFLYGDGYRFIAGSDFRDYNQELYKEIYPKFYNLGIRGNVNVASFVYDYANFGWLGLMLSGVVLALIFVFVDWIFRDNFLLTIVFNTFPCLFLSSSSYTTLLVTGGWGTLIVLFVLFKKNFNAEN